MTYMYSMGTAQESLHFDAGTLACLLRILQPCLTSARPFEGRGVSGWMTTYLRVDTMWGWRSSAPETKCVVSECQTCQQI
jgi:hypothetical protein